jgi:DNA-binding response OmpR family regulator
VIEDEPLVRANIVELLDAEDFDVVSAENGFMGALWAQENIPDLIICDVMMPEVNGYEVLSALRQEPMTATIPFIFLTAMADKADIRHGMELGADDYLTKPFTRAELLGAIATRFAKHEVVMQQYNTEHQRAEALQQKVKKLQQSADSKDDILRQLQQLYNAVSKINMAIQMLQNLQPGAQRDRCLEILQETCTREIALLNQMPNLQDLLTAENIKLLRQFNLISNETDKQDFGA